MGLGRSQAPEGFGVGVRNLQDSVVLMCGIPAREQRQVCGCAASGGEHLPLTRLKTSPPALLITKSVMQPDGIAHTAHPLPSNLFYQKRKMKTI